MHVLYYENHLTVAISNYSDLADSKHGRESPILIPDYSKHHHYLLHNVWTGQCYDSMHVRFQPVPASSGYVSGHI